jgi:uncharacterized protein (TIGR03663 family)
MFNLVFFFILLGRFWQLGLKPPHHDEAINGWFVIQMWQNGFYTYDPTNYHGPLLFYLYQVGEALGGRSVETFRFITVLASVSTLLWMVKWTQKRFGLSGWWSLGLALSPGFLFFTRSGIHESVFVFFTVVAATAWIDTWCLNRPEQLKVFLYGLLGTVLLKETFALPLAVGVLVSAPVLIKKEKWRALAPFSRDLLVHLAIVVFLWALFYSGFFHSKKGLVDFFRAFLPWTKTGVSGHGHEKEFFYFWKLIGASEWATALALVLSFVGLLFRGWTRGLCLWALGVLLAYSIIRYKTPWCLISMQAPLWLAAAVVIARSSFFWRQSAVAASVILGLFAIPTTVSLNFVDPTQTHPYVYVQTAASAGTFAKSLMRQAESRPEIRHARVQWGTEEPWPFPWWLSIYYSQSSLPVQKGVRADVDLILVDEGQEGTVEKAIQGEYWKTKLLVRDARGPAIAYLRKSLFECPFSDCEEFQR